VYWVIKLVKDVQELVYFVWI